MMTQREAVQWIERVDASVFHDANEAPESSWIAVVKTPGDHSGGAEHVILAFGETFLQAAADAQAQWSAHWSKFRHWN